MTAIDLTSLSPEQLLALKAQLDGIGPVAGRSSQFSKGVLASNPRQLHNLTLPPSATDPRPTFFWSAEPSRDPVAPGGQYPRLMWDGVTGAEITVYDAADQETHTARGFVLVAPVNADAPDPMETLRLALAQMSEADRTAVIAAAQRDRVAKLQEQLAALTDDQIESLLGATSPIKRGPGRPRKDQVA